ncbi:MAG: relaxase MobL [Erysipelotrichaceae bacterium]
MTKFYYLQHGKPAPSNSHYSGIVTTESIVGFKYYTSREEAKELSKGALKINEHLGKSFYDYTSQRIGATKTYSSIGWIDSPLKDAELKNLISESFHKDGDLIWTPIISLEDYMTSTEMKLFNEEDYAAVIQKVLPDWFKKTGFDYDNITFWMDHHVNTEHPHLHLNFLEKEKVHHDGKLKMKDINNLKSNLWKEIFSKKRYLEATGKSVEDGFKNKDILKKETVSKFKESMKASTNKEFSNQLKNLFLKLPSDGRLQYNSTHMIPFREELDLVVDTLLKTPGVNKSYQKFKTCISEFDEIRNKSLNTNYDNLASMEDKKLRTILANTILNEFKEVNCNQSVISNPMTSTREMDSSQPFTFKKIRIAKSLVRKQHGDYIIVRVPGSPHCISIEKQMCEEPLHNRETFFAYVRSDDFLEPFDAQGRGIDQIEFFDKGKEPVSHMDISNVDRYFTFQSFETARTDKIRNQIRDTNDVNRRENWIANDRNWNQMNKRVRGGTLNFMKDIEREVEEARNEFLNNHEEVQHV